MKMERYSEYKDSGVQWLGTIPNHWKTMRLGLLGECSNGVSKGGDYFGEGYPFVSYSDVYKNMELPHEVEGLAKSTDEDRQRYSVECGDVFFTRTSETIQEIGFSSTCLKTIPNAVFAGFLIRFRPTTLDLMPGFSKYYFRCNNLRSFYITRMNLVTRASLSQSLLRQLTVTIPPVEEQYTIISYLDDKCAKIDKMIDGKQKQIELLAEMKQRIVADAVTKGLNPNAKMKATNILWLPEIPENWKMSKVSSHFKQRNEKVSDKDYPALSVSKQGVTPQLANVALSNAEGCSRKLVKVGDYAVNSRSDRKGSCGVSKYEGSVSLITIVLEPFNIDGDYVHHLFRSNPWVEEFYRNGRGIVADLWTTNYQMMKSMYMPIPPIEEQKAIVAFINEKVVKIEALMSKLQQEIEAINEYKQRLISDVVTGQIKVC